MVFRGDRIKELREKAGYDTATFAAKINISRQSLYCYEADAAFNPSVATLCRICEVLHRSPADFFAADENEQLPAETVGEADQDGRN